MGLFKRKPTETAPAEEFEETLVAEEPAVADADLGALLTNEPLAPEPETPMGDSAIPWSTESPPPEPQFPADVEQHLRHDVNKLVLVEDKLDRPTKLDLEGKVTTAPRSALSEIEWHPRHRTSVKDMHAAIDRLRAREPRLVGNWLRTFKTSAILKPKMERVPQNILAKKIVYETEGGFVVEVTYRDGTETRKKFFTASSRDGRAKALAQIESGRYAQIHVIDDEKIAALRRKGGAHLPVPPGKVNTYAITNDIDVLEVEGIGEKYARRLHELGIHTTDQLRLVNATVVANNLGAAVTSVEKWQQMSELMLVKGVGKQSAEVLVHAGIAGIDQLKKQTPKKLVALVKAANKDTRLRGIQAASARSWILTARKMKKSLQDFPVVDA